EKSFEDLDKIEIKTDLGRYMYSRLKVATKEVREYMDSYRFNDGATTLYRFLWGEFCDWGIELSKAEKSSVKELGSIFKEAMKLLHPYMPFISEYLYQTLSNKELEDVESIMVQNYPSQTQKDEEIERIFELVIESIVSIRRAKATIDIPGKIESLSIKLNEDRDLSKAIPFIKLLGKSSEVNFISEKLENAVRDVSDNLEVFIPLSGVDLTPIIERLNAQKLKLEKEIAKLSGMLSNERFVANAPAEVVETNKKALNDAKEKMAKIEDELKALS
ncbi:MAG: valyl-tRNA synthetase, partial [Sulfurospirillum sp.]|nr:valyl-tRNA synthetase [Sulfurospirillum sp.]